jgi:hypothetical protein
MRCMKMLSRRTFLASAGVLAAGYVVARGFGFSVAMAAAPSSAFSVNGKIHIIGLNEPPGIKPEGSAAANSRLTTIDLKTGKVRQSDLAISDGHAALPLGEGRVACIAHHGRHSCVVDAGHKLMVRLTAPNDYLFGGHGLVLPDRNVFVAPVRHAKARTAADHGRFLIYDLGSLKETGQVEAAGLHPHEMRLIPGTREIAVTHYGDVIEPHPYYQHNVIASKLSIYDAGTLKEKRSYPQNDFPAMLTHMSVSPDGDAYCVMTQYFKSPKDRKLSVEERRERVMAAITKATGRAPDFNIPPQGLAEGRVAMPLPFLCINTKTGERQVIMRERNDHLRSQSVACNQQTAMAIASYFHSNDLVLHRQGHDPVILAGAKLGLQDVRGVAEIPGTPFFAVTGSKNDAVILNSGTLDVVARYSMDNAYAPHVEYEQA